jgi:hypothetical protein
VLQYRRFDRDVQSCVPFASVISLPCACCGPDGGGHHTTMLGEQLEAREELVETEDDREAMNLEERFEILDNLGSGAYATVYRARDRSRGGEVVALKKVYVREDRDIGIPQFIMREVANLKRLSTPGHRKDPHIVR